jgi:hypothetical protein
LVGVTIFGAKLNHATKPLRVSAMIEWRVFTHAIAYSSSKDYPWKHKIVLFFWIKFFY